MFLKRMAAKKPSSRSKPRRKFWSRASLVFCLMLFFGAGYATQKNPDVWRLALLKLGINFTRRVAAPNPTAARIVEAAKSQQGTFYSAAYKNISYPNGDVRKDRGACTDVVVRALRGAGYDLQKLIHEDISRNWKLYPSHWGLDHPDPNIDHRRVPNQMVFFERYGQKLTHKVSKQTRAQWQPGDIVCWKTGPRRWHIGVLSDGLNRRGWPLVVHNGSVCVEADCLTRWPIIGHYRFPAKRKA
jgi:uncharacterized protein YijF (DUF1287 family)